MSKRRLNNEGSIYKRESDGRWVAEITIGRNSSNGKLIKKYFYGEKQSIVKAKMDNFRKEQDKQSKEGISYDYLTFGNWLSEWLITYKKNNLKPGTYSDYEMMIRLYINPTLGNIPVKDITTLQLQKMYNNLFHNGSIKTNGGLSTRTIKYVHTVCNLALQKASDLKIIKENVAVFTELPKRNDKKEIIPLSIEEQLEFIHVVKNDRLEFAFLLALGTGIRIGELLALRWKNVNLIEGTLKIVETVQRVKNYNKKDENDTNTVLIFDTPKTASSIRDLPMPSALLGKMIDHKNRQLLEKQIANELYSDNDLVFATEIGTVTEPRNLERKFYKLLQKANLRHINFHVLRHTFTTRLVERNIHLKTLQELLGHSGTSVVTFNYAHASMDLKREAIEQLNYIFNEKV